MFDKLLSLCGKQDRIDDPYETIWEIKSSDLDIMSDIEIIYDKRNKTYLLSIETIYQFINGKAGEKTYIKNLFNKLTEWMVHKGYDTTQEVTLYEIFTQGKNINSEFETLEELYAVFKCLVLGFCKD